MTKIELAKQAVKIVVGIGSGSIVGKIVMNNTTREGLVDNITMPVTTYVIGSIVAKAAGQYTDNAIDSAVKWWKTNVTDK
jgi:Ni,Fe-hydrogenase III small subunit